MELSEKEKLITIIALTKFYGIVLNELSERKIDNINMPIILDKLRSAVINEKDMKNLIAKFRKEIED